MAKPKTHFEQVPLEIVKKIVAEEIPPEAIAEQVPKTKKQKVEKDLLESKKKFASSSRTASQLGLSE